MSLCLRWKSETLRFVVSEHCLGQWLLTQQAHESCACALSWSIACREPYAKILGIGTNNDGYTDKGITFPSGEAQRELGTSVSSALRGLTLMHRCCLSSSILGETVATKRNAFPLSGS